MIGMNNQLPVGGNGAGTLVLGDITIVQNHNFGAGNPQQMQMMQMQQQLAIQQQQNMMMLGMAATVAKQNKLLQAALGTVNSLTYPNEAIPQEEKKLLSASSESTTKSFTVDKSSAQTIDVEYEIKNDDFVDPFDILKHNESRVVEKHMGKFFENNELKSEYQFNKFYKIDEDTKTVVIFIEKDQNNPASWRKTFRTEYNNHTNKIIKGSFDSLIARDDTIYIMILISSKGGKPDIVFITKTCDKNEKRSPIPMEAIDEYVSGIGLDFGAIYQIVEPYIPENTVLPNGAIGFINNFNCIDHPICHLKDSIFSDGKYLVSDL